MSKIFLNVLVSTATLSVLMIVAAASAGEVSAQPRTTSSNAVSRQDDSVDTSASHHYQSPGERAKDALLITEVKSALAEDGVADDYPVAVDCDHGTIHLVGVVGSAEDARRAGAIAAKASGVVAVVNQLTWRKYD